MPSKWYYTVPSVFLALFLFGPFAFPLLWKSPQFNQGWKIGLTLGVTLLTFYLIYATWTSVAWLMEQMKIQDIFFP
jgi:hypothetical protein